MELNTKKTNQSNSKEYVYALGNIVGVKSYTKGVLVLENDTNNDFKRGDNLLYIEGEKINNSKDIDRVLNKLKKTSVNIQIERNNEIITKIAKIKNQEGKYKLGLWVRDKASQIATLTFYNPNNKQIYAIGHPIYDTDTNEQLKIKEGFMCEIKNINIIKSSNFKIGQIKGNFNEINKIGIFKENSEYGISCNLIKNIDIIHQNKKLQLASFKDIKKGKATILFQAKDKKIKAYDILIKDINKKNKILQLEITDKDLIDYTGGIVKGMSGAPIIQKNKLIGCITYVLKNNPKKGFGIFIEEMIK